MNLETLKRISFEEFFDMITVQNDDDYVMMMILLKSEKDHCQFGIEKVAVSDESFTDKETAFQTLVALLNESASTNMVDKTEAEIAINMAKTTKRGFPTIKVNDEFMIYAGTLPSDNLITILRRDDQYAVCSIKHHSGHACTLSDYVVKHNG